MSSSSSALPGVLQGKSINFPVPAGSQAIETTSRRSSGGGGGGSASAASRKARKCTADTFSPSQRLFGTVPFDYNENTFEAMEPMNFNKAKLRAFANDRVAHNAIWFCALKVLPAQKVFDFIKDKNTSSVLCEHASQGYPLRNLTIQQCVDQAATAFGLVEDNLPVKYSMHHGDGERQYMSNGKHTVWLCDALPIVNKFDIYLQGVGQEAFVADGVDASKTQWCTD
jgi:hypothetical protein